MLINIAQHATCDLGSSPTCIVIAFISFMALFLARMFLEVLLSNSIIAQPATCDLGSFPYSHLSAVITSFILLCIILSSV